MAEVINNKLSHQLFQTSPSYPLSQAYPKRQADLAKTGKHLISTF